MAYMRQILSDSSQFSQVNNSSKAKLHIKSENNTCFIPSGSLGMVLTQPVAAEPLHICELVEGWQNSNEASY